MTARRLFMAALLALALAGPALSARAEAPGRVVSINLCADQLLVLLADRSAIAAVSILADESELSFVADRVAGIPTTDGTAESVLALAPDLVLAGRYTTRPAVELLRARGVPVLDLDLPTDFEGIRDQVRMVAAALGREARGESLIADMDSRLESVRVPDGGSRPTALVWQAGGFTAGSGTLPHAVLEAAGFANFASEQGLKGYGYLPLETVVAGRPDVLVVDQTPPGRPSLAETLLNHSALARAAIRTLRSPGALWACAGPFTAGAVERLTAAHEAPVLLPGTGARQ